MLSRFDYAQYDNYCIQVSTTLSVTIRQFQWLCMRSHNYFVYMLRCADGSYYTGMTNDVEHRFHQHQSGIDPTCYTFSRRPLSLAYVCHFSNVLDAITHEKRLKGWGRKKKQALIMGALEKLPLLAKKDFSRRKSCHPSSPAHDASRNR